MHFSILHRFFNTLDNQGFLNCTQTNQIDQCTKGSCHPISSMLFNLVRREVILMQNKNSGDLFSPKVFWHGHMKFCRHEIAQLMKIHGSMMRPRSLRLTPKISAPQRPENELRTIDYGIFGKAIDPSMFLDPSFSGNHSMKIRGEITGFFCLPRSKEPLLSISNFK